MTDSSFVTDVTASTFATEVIEESFRNPVLVDFWAAWCAPCRMLAPILETIASKYAGAIRIAKVDTDTETELATRYGIRSLPTVALFSGGRITDQFLGAQPESSVRAFIEKHLPSPLRGEIKSAMNLHAAGRFDEAKKGLRSALAAAPDDDDVILTLTRVLIDCADLADAAALLKKLSPRNRDGDEARSLRSRLRIAEAATVEETNAELEHRVQQNPDDCAARLALGARRALAQRYEEAMEELLEVVQRDRQFGDDAGRRGLLDVFSLLGPTDDRVARYRGKLARAIN